MYYWKTFFQEARKNSRDERKIEREVDLEDYETLVLTPVEVEEPVPFDLSLLDRLDSFDESAANEVFSPDHMAAVAADLDTDPRTISLTEAEQTGILDWQT